MKLLISLRDISLSSTKSLGISKVALGLTQGLMQCLEATSSNEQDQSLQELHILSNHECTTALKQARSQCPQPTQVHLHGEESPIPRGLQRILWDQWGVSAATRHLQADWLLLPKGFPPYLPRLGKSKLACYLHDVNWEYYQDPQHLKGGKDSPYPFTERLYFTQLGLRCLEIANCTLCSSQFNKARYLAHRPHSQPQVIGIGFDAPPSPRSKAEHIQARDVLATISPYPHKRGELVIPRLQAWLAQRHDKAHIRLHLLGRLPHHQQLPPTGQWQQHQGIAQEELDYLLRTHCRASVYFSDYEGYGMPPVEHLRMGIPCAASDIPAIRENIPPSYLFQNESEADFIRCLNRAYDASPPIPCPHSPSWQEVAKLALASMRST